MSLSRSALLWMSQNEFLRSTLPRFRFVRGAVKRFMPGEQLDDALAAAAALQGERLPTILTQLGENIVELREAESVTKHYLDVANQVSQRHLDSYISVKLTQMGFDIDKEECYRFFSQLAAKGKELGNLVWIDIEGSAYAEGTIQFYRRVKKEFENTGLCLQSYLYRTEHDLEGLLAEGSRIRLVKGAYKEPPSVAMPKKRDVDENFFECARKMLAHTQSSGIVHGIGTHDMKLVRRIIEEANRIGLSRDKYEFQMLYGIRSAEQRQLRLVGYRVRVLISYGAYWYPWYMRRLAERPANVWFVMKNLLRRG